MDGATDEMLQAAMKEAVVQKLVPKFAGGEEEYLRLWRAVESVLNAALAVAPRAEPQRTQAVDSPADPAAPSAVGRDGGRKC